MALDPFASKGLYESPSATQMHKAPRRRARWGAVVIAAAAASHAMTVGALADTVIWDGGGDGVSWNDAANWNVAPAANDILRFTGTVGLTNTNNLAANTNFNGITFDGTGSFTIGGNAINLSGGITNTATTVQTLGLALSLQQSDTILSSQGSTLTLNGDITGSGDFGIIKLGTSGLTLGGASSVKRYAIREGTLTLAPTVTIDPTATFTFGTAGRTGAIPATLSFTRVGGSALTLGSTDLAFGRAAVISGRSSGAGTATLDLGVVSRAAGTTLDLTVQSNSAIKLASTLGSGAAAVSNGILGKGWASFRTNPTGAFGSWATLNGSNQVVAYTGYTSISGAAPVLAGTGTQNVMLSSNTSTLAASMLINSTTITGVNTAGLSVGQAVSGAGTRYNNGTVASGSLAIAAGSVITSIDSVNNLITISMPVYGGVGGSQVGTIAPNSTLTLSDTITAAGAVSLNTLQTGTTVNQAIDLGGAQFRTNAIWRSDTGGLGGTRFSNGSITAGDAPDTSAELIINAAGQSATNSSTASLARNQYGFVFDAAITNNGTGVVSVIKTGTSSTLFNVANSYTGTTYVQQGRLVVNHANALPSGATVFVNGGAASDGLGGDLQLNAEGTYNNNFTIAGYGPFLSNIVSGVMVMGNNVTVAGQVGMTSESRVFSLPGANSTITARITGVQGAGIELLGSSATVTLTNSANDYSGNTTLDAGNNTAKLVIGGTGEVIPNGAGKGNFLFLQSSTSGSAVGTLDLNGNSETINGLTSSGAGAETRRIITSGVAGAVTFSIGDGNASGSFLGRIQNGSGTLSLVKLGTGTQTLTGTNSFSGGTTINGGILAISGTTTTLGTGKVEVNEGGTLQILASAVSGGMTTVISNSAMLSIADGVDPGTVVLETGVNETVGSLVLDGVAMGGGTYGSSTSSAANIFDDYFSGSGIITVVPEPASLGMVFAGAGALLYRRRRTRTT